MIIVPTPKLREALTASSSLGQAAKACGVSPQTLRWLAYRHHMGALLEACKRRGLSNTGKPVREGQYNFVDMTGRTLVGVEVLRRVANGTGNANWRVKHLACGHEGTFEGIRLRAAEKHGETLRCRVCQPKRTVRHNRKAVA